MTQPGQSYIERLRSLEHDVEDAREDLDRAEDRLEAYIEAANALPDKATLLAVYGAPGNWPIEAADSLPREFGFTLTALGAESMGL